MLAGAPTTARSPQFGAQHRAFQTCRIQRHLEAPLLQCFAILKTRGTQMDWGHEGGESPPGACEGTRTEPHFLSEHGAGLGLGLPSPGLARPSGQLQVANSSCDLATPPFIVTIIPLRHTYTHTHTHTSVIRKALEKMQKHHEPSENAA